MKFPYIGAGTTFLFEWAFLSVVFEREPTEEEKKRIVAILPKPFSEYQWEDRVLQLSSDYGVQLTIVEAYGDEMDEEDEYVEDCEVTTLADEKAFQAFSADTEQFLKAAHSIVPIQLAYREEDDEAGGTELNRWHEESCDFVGRHIQRWDEEKAREVLTPALRVLVSALQDMEKIIPPENWNTSGWLGENQQWFTPLAWYYDWAGEVENRGWGQPISTFRKLMKAGDVKEAWDFYKSNLTIGLDIYTELNALFCDGGDALGSHKEQSMATGQKAVQTCGSAAIL